MRRQCGQEASSSGASDREGEQLRPVSASEPLTSVESTEPLRIFVASAADLLTDRAQHGEGLIAWQTFSALAERGHELVVCAREADLASDPPFDVVETGRRLRWESLEPLAHARHIRRLFDRYGGTASFDAVHWLFPQEPLCFVPPRDVSFVVGPRSLRWANGSGVSRPRRAGDLVRVVSSPIFATARRRALSRASHVLVSTPGAVVDVPPAERRKVSVQPFGVDLSRFRVESFPEAPTVLFIGRLDPVKRVTALVEAFGLLARRHSRCEARHRGRGAGTACDRVCAADVAAGQLRRAGREGSPRRRSRLAGDVHRALPSFVGEPFGMVVLEAMASGRAVVAVRGGGPDSLVDPGLGGALAPSGTPAALAQALLDVLGDRKTPRRMGAYNRRRATSEFGVARLADALERCYRGERPTVRARSEPGNASHGGVMKILFVSAPALDARFGGAKPFLELAEQFEALGWQPELVSLAEEVPGHGSQVRVGRARFLRDLIVSRGDAYDVVDFDHEYLPFERATFPREALLVARSVLLCQRVAVSSFPQHLSTRRIVGRVLRDSARRADQREMAAFAQATVLNADLVNVSNDDDAEFLVQAGIERGKVVVLPFGMSASRLSEFALAPSEEVVTRIAFVGTFDWRKGAADMPRIVERVICNGARSALSADRHERHVLHCRRRQAVLSARSPSVRRSRSDIRPGRVACAARRLHARVLSLVPRGVPDLRSSRCLRRRCLWSPTTCRVRG